MQMIAEQVHPRQFQKLAGLMDQQFWRWGCDVKHDSGNLLVDYGFERIPSSNPELDSSSAYCLNPSPATRLVLRSFSVFYGDDRVGGLLLKRFDEHLYRTPASKLRAMPYQETDLPPLSKAAPGDTASFKLLVDLIGQIVAYEAWVRTTFGIEYVQKTLEKRQKRPVAFADEAEPIWEAMAQQVSLKDAKLA